MRYGPCTDEVHTTSLPSICGEPTAPRCAVRPPATATRGTWEARRAPYPVEQALLQADALAVALRSALDRIAVPLARAARGFVQRQGWTEFGFARIEDHTRERFGRSGRWVRDLAAIGEGLETLPDLAAIVAGLDDGLPIGRVAALLVVRVATAASLPSWVALARKATVRDLRQAVARARRGGSEWPPADTGAPDLRATTAAAADMEDAADRTLVRLPVPRPVQAAFDEAVDLHRAVQGAEAGVTSFVDALVAEAMASGDDAPPDAEVRPLSSGSPMRAVEDALARASGNWRHLPQMAGPSWALALAGEGLERLASVERVAGRGGPADLDAQIRMLISLENDLEIQLGRVLAGMCEARAWPRLWFAGAAHYAEERLRLSRTASEDRMRAARSLRRFPGLRQAYENGQVGLEAALTVVRILGDGTPEAGVERAWVEHARITTVKRLRDEARALRLRHLATGGCDSAASQPETTSAAGGSLQAGRTPDAGPLDDAAWHASIRRDPGTARRRILTAGLLASGIGAGAIRAACPGSERRPRMGAAPETALPCAPDVFLRLRLPRDLADCLLAAIESARRRLSAVADALPWDEDFAEDARPRPSPAREEIRSGEGAPPSLRAARTFSIRCRRVPAWVGLLALLEDFAFTWDPPHPGQRRPGEEVYCRDGWRCAAPGCTSRRHLESHHLVYRSRGGGDDPANRICLCRLHHQRGEHGDLASCSGKAPLGVVWRLGKSAAGGAGIRPAGTAEWYRNERLLSGWQDAAPGAGARR